MNRKVLGALAGLLMVALLVISPVSAQAQTSLFRASGSLDAYNPSNAGLTAQIVVGSWNVKISQLEVDFRARYLEENTIEEIPGTKDVFRLSFSEVTGVTVVGSSAEIEGTLEFAKKGWDPATGKPRFGTLVFPGSRITIDESAILFFLIPGLDWIIIGSTRSISS